MRPAPPSGTYWVPVADGALLAGPHPVLAPEGLEDRVAKLVEDFGVTHFVDLSGSDDWMPPYVDHVTERWRQVAYTRYAIRDRWLPDDVPRLREVLAQVLAEARGGLVAYLHCQAGLGRTGTVVGCLLRETGLGGDEALDELVRLRAEARLHEGSPEFEEQREFVRTWVPARPA